MFYKVNAPPTGAANDINSLALLFTVIVVTTSLVVAGVPATNDASLGPFIVCTFLWLLLNIKKGLGMLTDMAIFAQ